jgi:putative nucleotidyltransferase with HDIG domain
VPETGLAKTVAWHVQRLDEQCQRLEREIQLYQALGDFEAAGFSFDVLRRTFYETSQALADAIEMRDAYTGGHTKRVTEYSLAAGTRLGLKPDELERLRVAAILHDIGKSGVDDRVLRKPGRLDRLEIEQMQKHPALGADILDHVHYLADILPGIRSHHERTDGRGYPDGLQGERIPLVARIIAVADTYDAMTSDRPYRRGMNKSAAIREIARCSGTQFDTRVVQAFMRAYTDGEITGTAEPLPSNAPRGD